MKWLFDQIHEIEIKYQAIETLDRYEWYLTKQQVKELKLRISKELLDVIEKNIYKLKK